MKPRDSIFCTIIELKVERDEKVSIRIYGRGVRLASTRSLLGPALDRSIS